MVDAFRREALAIDVDQGIKGEQVVEAMTGSRCCVVRSGPSGWTTVRSSISKALNRRPYEDCVTLDVSRPGKPTGNPFVESFDGRLRDECLNTHRFLSIEDARAKVEAWRGDYNEGYAHTSLGWLSPIESAAAAAIKAADRTPDTRL